MKKSLMITYEGNDCLNRSVWYPWWEYMVDFLGCSLILMAYFVPTCIHECQTWHVQENKPEMHLISDN